MIHKLKIQKQYADEIDAGRKLFEIRYNDRNFQKGDLIEFKVVEKDNLYYKRDQIPYTECIDFESKKFLITYVLSYFPEGLKDNYVILGILPVTGVIQEIEK